MSITAIAGFENEPRKYLITNKIQNEHTSKGEATLLLLDDMHSSLLSLFLSELCFNLCFEHENL
jgi:hypothetical protein